MRVPDLHRPESDPADPTRRRAGYAAVVAVYVTAVAASAIVLRRRGTRLPERICVVDLVITALATQRASRLLAKEPVTRPVRAPFTEFVAVSGPAELEERARDDSMLRHTIGELLSCPFCLGQWIATVFVMGHVVCPRATRLVTSLFAVVGAADAMHHVMSLLTERTAAKDDDSASAAVAAGGEAIGTDPKGDLLVEGPQYGLTEPPHGAT